MFYPRLLYQSLKDYGYAITARRCSNLLAVTLSAAATRLTGRATVWGDPIILMVEPTDLCNLRCPLCPSGSGQPAQDGRAHGMMRIETFRSIIDEIGATLCLVILWNRGEPLLHPSFVEMVRIAKAARIPVITSTNAHPLVKKDLASELVASGIDEVIVSVDGIEQETYQAYRKGGDLETVIEGIGLLRAARERRRNRKPTINLQFIVMRQNLHEMDRVERFAREAGADKLTMKTVFVSTPREAAAFLPDDPKLGRYRFDGDRLEQRNRRHVVCSRLWRGTVINWDGTVSPCCFDRDGRHSMGKVAPGDVPLGRIWRDNAYISFRQHVIDDREAIDICRRCTEGVRDMFYSVDYLK